ncbi:putative protein-like [Forsythia ovata]|uniref:Uncharacterized protein n=1 Tax=Forsythia ovata TaxID=205694 RepID=A0ABD1WU59_9LAMI
MLIDVGPSSMEPLCLEVIFFSSLSSSRDFLPSPAAAILLPLQQQLLVEPKWEGCKHYHILGEIFSGITATGGLGHASTQLPATSEEERQLEDDFLNRGVHVHVENLDDDANEIPKTHRREEIGTSGERRRKEPKISKSDKLEACMNQWSSTVSLKNEETELRTLYLKEKRAKIQEKSCNHSASEATSPNLYSNIVCLDILNNMEGVSNEVYMKALKAFKDPDFRVSFVRMPKARREPILELL